PDSLRVSPVKLGHHTHQPHPIFYTVGEEKAIARAKKEKEEEKRRKQFTALLNKTSPSTKRKKKNVLLKKIIKRSIDDSGTGEKMSDKMAGYVGNVSGLITLPDRGSTEYENQVSWLLRNQSTLGRNKAGKRYGHAGNMRAPFVSVEDLQAQVNEERQIKAVNKAYENMLEEQGSNIGNQVVRRKRDRKKL
ncbi:hypothetical protein TeGR_g5417, partial [Tetraparma gracilis]